MPTKTVKNWWIYAAATLCILPVLPLIPGCKGSFSAQGGPTLPTPRPTRTPTPTPVGTPRPTPIGTPGATPGVTPIPTPSNTPFPTPLVGNYAGTFSVSSLGQVSRQMTIIIGADGTAAAQVTFTNGDILSLTGNVDQATKTLNLSGNAIVAGANAPSTFTLTGQLTTGQSNFVSGSGAITSSTGNSGTWQARKTG